MRQTPYVQGWDAGFQAGHISGFQAGEAYGWWRGIAFYKTKRIFKTLIDYFNWREERS